MKEITLKELRTIQLEMLDVIHKFCIEHKIRYSIEGGTLLGAVRHGGYIPWDDDIDILMPRPDYEKFIAIFNGYSSNLAVQHSKIDDAYRYLFAKVYDNRTVLIEDAMISGVFIDVFPFDGQPSSKEQHYEYASRYLHLFSQLEKATKFYKFQKDKNQLVLRLKYLIKKMLYPSRKRTLSELDAFFSAYPFDTSEYIGCVVGAYPQKVRFERKIFDEYTTIKFENREYCCLKDYHTYLSTLYGDYMKLPPKEKQVTHHNFIAYWK